MKFFGDGMAFVLETSWAESHGITSSNVSEVLPGVAMSLKWFERDRTCWLLHFRLDPFREDQRCTQLRQLADWVNSTVGKDDVLLIGGDRLTCNPIPEHE